MEIERKFLVSQLPENLENYKSLNIKQSYISRSPTIRLRQQDDLFILTCKGYGGLSREEWEIEITKDEFLTLSKKVEGNTIHKTRYLINIENNLVAELDIYYGNLLGLKTVEVEFESEEDAMKFIPPSWFGLDVTFDKNYKNSTLSLK